MPAKLFKDGYEEASYMRRELKRLMAMDPMLQDIKNFFVTKGIDRAKIDIIVTYAYRDLEKQRMLLRKGKKFYLLSLVFLSLFIAGVVMWFYVWGDWITYFAGANLILFLFMLQRGNALRGQAEIYDTL